MIPIEKLQRIYLKSQLHLKSLPNYQQIFRQVTCTAQTTQISRGITSRLWKNYSGYDCRHYDLILHTYNVIPSDCFNCYKIVIAPSNVIDLFRLMVVFDEIDLPADNTRKCMVEIRPEVSGYYKGLVYCENLQEAHTTYETIQETILDELADNATLFLKRGCSHQSFLFPEFEKVDENNEPIMEYPADWAKIEKRAKDERIGSHLEPIYVDRYDDRCSPDDLKTYDAIVMLNWIKYAATIGDQSYMDLTKTIGSKLSGLDRPSFPHE